MMKTIVAAFLLLAAPVAAQQKGKPVIKDLDGDAVTDTVSFDPASGRIVCRLSTRKFRPTVSQPGLADEVNCGVRATKSGFEFYVNYMRAGYANQFRYERAEQKIRLIGMSRYEFGPASNDGSGESSVNLLTNSYIGEWNHFNDAARKLVKMPTIKTKMYFPKTYLAGYSGTQQAEFEEKCSALYYQQKAKMP